jgi:lipopolysaccharide/colanic/teichoic acid biosynthesis glycosyltransferase
MSIIGPRPLTLQTFGSYPPQIQELIKQVSPGLSGIGSIIFRREEELLAGHSNSVDFYNKVVAPYKGLLEKWYVENLNLKTYFAAIFITAWVVIFPRSTLVWITFPRLPLPPIALKTLLNYPD